MSRSIDDLCPKVRPLILKALALMVAKGLHIIITDTLRTRTEQQVLLEQKRSWTLNSKHLPQIKCDTCHQLKNSEGTFGMAHALDVAVYLEWKEKGSNKLNWDITHPDWATIGQCVKEAGLRWGGDWKVKDLAHMELF